MKMKKFVAGVAAAAMLTLSMGAFVGCGQSDEEVIREALTEELESIKNQDASYMAELSAEMGDAELASYGIDAADFMSKYLSGFDYSIDSVTVNGDTAEAVVTLTCKSFSDYEAAIEAETMNAIQTQDIYSMSDQDINLLVGQIMMTALDKVDAVPTTPITIEYFKNGNTWEPTEASSDAITSAMLSN